jgi:hypothetical protein
MPATNPATAGTHGRRKWDVQVVPASKAEASQVTLCGESSHAEVQRVAYIENFSYSNESEPHRPTALRHHHDHPHRPFGINTRMPISRLLPQIWGVFPHKDKACLIMQKPFDRQVRETHLNLMNVAELGSLFT